MQLASCPCNPCFGRRQSGPQPHGGHGPSRSKSNHSRRAGTGWQLFFCLFQVKCPKTEENPRPVSHTEKGKPAAPRCAAAPRVRSSTHARTASRAPRILLRAPGRGSARAHPTSASRGPSGCARAPATEPPRPRAVATLGVSRARSRGRPRRRRAGRGPAAARPASRARRMR